MLFVAQIVIAKIAYLGSYGSVMTTAHARGGLLCKAFVLRVTIGRVRHDD